MKGKNLYILLAVVILILLLWVSFVYFWNDNNQNNKNFENSKQSYNPQQEKMENKKVSLPEEVETCKNKTDLVDCVLHYDDSKWKTRDVYTLKKENLTNRLDSLSSHIDSINKQKENFEKELVSNIQEQYINYNPQFVLREANCKTSYCEKTVKNIKKQIIKEMKSIWRLSGKWSCEKIPSQDLRNYCKNLF